MKILNISVAVCGHCANYTVLGKRGGQCQLLGGVSVQSKWKGCHMAVPAFVSADISGEAIAR